MLRASCLIAIKTIFILFVLTDSFSFASEPNSNPVLIDSTSYNQGFNNQIHHLESGGDARSIEHYIQLRNSEWRLNDTNTPSYGISKKTHWFKVSLLNNDSKKNDFILLCDYGALDELEVFWVDPTSGDIIGSEHTGDHLPFHSRPVEHVTYALPFKLDANTPIDVYLRIKTDGNLVVPLAVYESSMFFKEQKNIYMLYAFVLTVMFLTAIYNLFIYIQTREPLFLTFAIFSLFITLLAASQFRLSFQYMWPTWPYWEERILLATVCSAAISHLCFSTFYLALKGNVKNLFFLMMSCNGVVLLLVPFMQYGLILKICLIAAMVTAVVSISSSGILWIRGQRTAKIYTLAWSVFIIGTFVSASIRFGITPFNWFTEYSGILGAVITTAALSMALGDRIRAEKQNRIEAQNSAIKNLERYEALFENAVEGIFLVNSKRQFIAANPSFLKMLGYPDLPSLQAETTKGIRTLFEEPEHVNRIREELTSNREFSAHEVTLKKSDSESFWVSMSARIVMSSDKRNFRIEGSIIDISSRKKTEQKLKYLASHDPLTETFNRREFESQLSQALMDTRESRKNYCVLYMDLDQFKVLNDTCGHTAGDILLRELTQLMISKLNNRGMLARLGGDEFGVLLRNTTAKKSYKIAQELLTLIRNYRFSYKKRIFSLGASIGLVEITEASESLESIMSLADTACYVAKDAGRNRIHVYSAENVELQKRRTEMELVISINNALENDLFELHRQVISRADSMQRKLGYEILIRMRDEKGRLIHPGTFIPAAERFNLMRKIDHWVIENSFRYLASNKISLRDDEHYSINLSGQSMADENLSDYLTSCFNTYKIPYKNICFEITETAAVFNLSFMLDLMKKFQELGCMFSLDDFGSGFSSYGYLKTLPVDYLKIDGSFVINIAEDKVDFAMVKSINEVAQALNMQTIAEFVEDAAIVEKLEEIGVDYLQGFGIARPEIMDIFGDSESDPKQPIEQDNSPKNIAPKM